MDNRKTIPTEINLDKLNINLIEKIAQYVNLGDILSMCLTNSNLCRKLKAITGPLKIILGGTDEFIMNDNLHKFIIWCDCNYYLTKRVIRYLVITGRFEEFKYYSKMYYPFCTQNQFEYLNFLEIALSKKWENIARYIASHQFTDINTLVDIIFQNGHLELLKNIEKNHKITYNSFRLLKVMESGNYLLYKYFIKKYGPHGNVMIYEKCTNVQILRKISIRNPNLIRSIANKVLETKCTLELVKFFKEELSDYHLTPCYNKIKLLKKAVTICNIEVLEYVDPCGCYETLLLESIIANQPVVFRHLIKKIGKTSIPDYFRTEMIIESLKHARLNFVDYLILLYNESLLFNICYEGMYFSDFNVVKYLVKKRIYDFDIIETFYEICKTGHKFGIMTILNSFDFIEIDRQAFKNIVLSGNASTMRCVSSFLDCSQVIQCAPIEHVVKTNNLDMLKALINLGYKINKKDLKLFNLAIDNCNSGFIKYLLYLGFNISSKTNISILFTLETLKVLITRTEYKYKWLLNYSIDIEDYNLTEFLQRENKKGK